MSGQRRVSGSATKRIAAIVVLTGMLGELGCEKTPPAPGEPDIEARGRTLYNAALASAGGDTTSCAECHGPVGQGGSAPNIQESPSDHLITHLQGGGAHPEGLKYPDLTAADLDALAHFLGAEEDEHDDDDDHEPLVGDPVRGQQLFTTPLESTAVALSCANCHAADGSSGFGPDIRGEETDHLQVHAQGGGRHEPGVKYPALTAQDFADMAAFLAGDADHDHTEDDPDHHEPQE